MIFYFIIEDLFRILSIQFLQNFFHTLAMRTDLKFKTLAEELHYQRTSRITLMNELLTCYQYLKEHNMLFLYEAYRNGEELPFD